MCAIGAGVFQLRFWRFTLVTFFSRGLRFFLVSTAIFFFREQAKRLVADYFELFTITFGILLIGGFVILKWVRRDVAPRQPLDAS